MCSTDYCSQPPTTPFPPSPLINSTPLSVQRCADVITGSICQWGARQCGYCVEITLPVQTMECVTNRDSIVTINVCKRKYQKYINLIIFIGLKQNFVGHIGVRFLRKDSLLMSTGLIVVQWQLILHTSKQLMITSLCYCFSVVG